MAKIDEKLKNIDDKIAQLKAQKQAMKAREKAKERADRTRRLIQNGALAEKYLQCQDADPLLFEQFLNRLVNTDRFADLIFQAKQDSAMTLSFENEQPERPDDEEEINL
jgi:multidrug resistance efflux pump